MAENFNFNNKKKDQKKVTETPEPPIVGPTEIVGVNFRRAGKIYYFSPKNKKFKIGENVIVETARGLEFGTVKIENKIIDGSKITPPLKPIIRKATEDDFERVAANHQLEMDAAVICKKKIAAHGLTMRLIGVEYTFDNSKLIFYFTCESRVDFRELVKDLASTFKTRIELRQVGIRDETKLMGGLASCGRPYCCADFLIDFVQVSIKMAKEQNFSLNSAKVSGACGRLMCCLRYEHEVYENAIKVTPPVGSVVETADGVGNVIETNPLAEQIKVRITDKNNEEIRLYSCKDVKVLKVGNGKKAKDHSEDS
ncbi:MAG: stage 0 sporulation family protein [Clostridia bacterium]|nr:stage 0 sporulation family protein [Clostridia bacterium]